MYFSAKRYDVVTAFHTLNKRHQKIIVFQRKFVIYISNYGNEWPSNDVPYQQRTLSHTIVNVASYRLLKTYAVDPSTEKLCLKMMLEQLTSLFTTHYHSNNNLPKCPRITLFAKKAQMIIHGYFYNVIVAMVENKQCFVFLRRLVKFEILFQYSVRIFSGLISV